MKETFFDSDFVFRKIILFATSNQIKNKTKIKITLLVDDNNLIHDFKLEFLELYITRFTTNSHLVQAKRKDLELRKTILNILNLEHSFEKTNKKEYIFFKNKKLLKLNEYLNKFNFFHFTFQQIEYLVTGSNPSGQGNAKGFFNLELDNKKYVFGFFLQSLHINKLLNKMFTQKSLFSVYDKLWKDKNVVEILFQDWIKQNDFLWNNFLNFIYNSSNWKEIKSSFQTQATSLIERNFINIQKLVIEKRNEFSLKIKNTFPSNNQIYNYFFDSTENNLNRTFEKAHIKPVWLIKKDFIKTNNYELLNQISDLNNFLPLPVEIHKSYDNKQFYWNLDGNLKEIKLVDKLNDLDYFKKINVQTLNNIKKYLLDYYNYLKDKFIIK